MTLISAYLDLFIRGEMSGYPFYTGFRRPGIRNNYYKLQMLPFVHGSEMNRRAYDHQWHNLIYMQAYIANELRTFPPEFSPRTFPPDFDEQSCVNRSWTQEKSFYELEAGLMKVCLVNQKLDKRKNSCLCCQNVAHTA